MRKIIHSIFLSFVFFSVSSQTREQFYTMIHEINSDSLKKTVIDLQNFPSRFCLHNNTEVAQYIVSQLQQYGIENAHIDSFYVDNKYSSFVGYYSAWMYNVKATLSGNGTNDSTLIIGAHFDAITYNSDRIPFSYTLGANDNASGIAIMLEMARIYHKYQIKPIKNIDFMAFDGEELGLKGAYYDAKKRKAENQPIVIMMNNDMVGYQPIDKEWKFQLIEYPTSQDNTPIAEHACRCFTSLSPVAIDAWDLYSDSYYYYMQGFKCFYGYEYYDDPHYHSAEDTYENLNFDYMKEVAILNFALMYQYAIGNVFEMDSTTAINTFADYISDINIYPNPSNNLTNIQFSLFQTSEITIKLLDITGKEIYRLPTQTYAEGTHKVLIDCRNISSGMYFCSINNQYENKTSKLILY